MDIATYLLSGAILVAVIFFGIKKRSATSDPKLIEENANLKASNEQANKSIGSLEEKLKEAQTKRDEFAGKNKGMYSENTELKASIRSLTSDKQALEKKVTKSETEQEQRQNKYEEMVANLEAAKTALDDERNRVRHEDDERQKHLEEERDRIWAEHEKNVIAELVELCKQPQYSFSCFTNTSLPPDLIDGSLKPDFMIEFLGQYVIFDAKKSKSESLQTYINNTIKKTVQKVKNNDKIAPFIYLVVPTEAIGELKSHYYVHDGFTLYVISPEALAPILASLKKITAYEFAEQMDPQKRENIVQWIAELDFHVNLRNAADIILTKMGADLLERTQRSDPQLAEEVAIKKQPMNAKASIAASDLKKLVSQLSTQSLEVQKLVSPKAAVKGKTLKDAESLLSDSMS
ncbi:MAG: hypothetical protein WCS85_04715 [Candidatus Peribacteraceae bacterium]|jgi:hypothetical protein